MSVWYHVWHDTFNVWHNSFICVTCLIHMCEMTHLYVWLDSCICVTWLIYMWDMTHSYVWHDADAFSCVSWLILNQSCRSNLVMTHSYIWMMHIRNMTHMCVTSKRVLAPFLFFTSSLSVWYYMTYRSISLCNMTHSDVWHDSCIFVTWLIHVQLFFISFLCVVAFVVFYVLIVGLGLRDIWRVTYTYAWHDSFVYGRYDSFLCVPSLILMCDMTHSYVWHDSFICERWLIHMCDSTM